MSISCIFTPNGTFIYLHTRARKCVKYYKTLLRKPLFIPKKFSEMENGAAVPDRSATDHAPFGRNTDKRGRCALPHFSIVLREKTPFCFKETLFVLRVVGRPPPPPGVLPTFPVGI